MATLRFSDLTNSPDQEDLIKKTWRGITFIMITGVILTLALSLFSPKPNGSNSTFLEILSTFGCSLLIGGAAFAAGGFGGFIFGIPSLGQNKESDLKYNDNLIQISDWLTKIIVGVGLVQLNRIPGKISELGDLLRSNFGDQSWGKVASLSIVFYFSLFGFLIVYFWTRTDFTTIIKKVDTDLNDQLAETKEELETAKKKALEEIQEIEKQKQILEAEKRKIETVVESIAAKKSSELVKQTPGASAASEFETLKNESPEKYKDALDKLKEKVRTVLKSKPVVVTDDLQKGRWGGKSENNGKQIVASVSTNIDNNFYDISIEIYDTSKPLDVPAAIFVHETFNMPDDVIYVTPNIDGKAQIMLSAYEAFTVGALFADGTELELDMNQQKGYPPGFYWVETR
ncbi:MAG: hypothetical protein HOP10_09180 [Chitinophagaceae bacterium]|nr:hypothetical protein [Chitinophagaceae bacterium]